MPIYQFVVGILITIYGLTGLLINREQRRTALIIAFIGIVILSAASHQAAQVMTRLIHYSLSTKGVV